MRRQTGVEFEMDCVCVWWAAYMIMITHVNENNNKISCDFTTQQHTGVIVASDLQFRKSTAGCAQIII